MSKKRDEPFNNPFAAVGKELKKKLKQQKKAAPAPRPVVQQKMTKAEKEEAMFARYMAGAERLTDDPRGTLTPPDPPADARNVPMFDEEAETYAKLVDLVEGRTHFDISDSDEFIEGVVTGLDRRILSKLKRGEYAFRRHLDLHGLTRDEAREAVERFVVEARRDRERCILIVHGRGKNSKDNIPVLKGLLRGWLERGRIAKSVLAFCSARPHDGGAGAMYVLLRK